MGNVLIISESSIIGGAEIVLKDYIENTTKAKNIFVVIPKNNLIERFYQDLTIGGYYTSPFLCNTGKYLSLLLKPILSFLLAIKLISIISKNNITTIVTNNTPDILYLIFIKLFFPKIKYCAYVHDMISQTRVNKILFEFFSKSIVNNFIAVSNAVKARLLFLTSDDSKIKMIFNGLSVSRMEPKSIGSIFKVLFVGRMEDRKNPNEFLDFLITLKDANVVYEAFLIYNEMDNTLLDAIKYRISDNKLDVILKKDLNRSKVFELMRSVDFLFISSKRDPLPTVVLESMNSGTPVIGKNIDGIPDMIEDESNGYLYNTTDDFKGIIEKIKNLKCEDYSRLSYNALSIIQVKFNIKRKVEKLDNLLFADEI